MEVEKIIEEKFQGIELPQNVKEKIIGVVAEYETNLGKATNDIEFQKAEAKKAFDKRDEIKKEFRTYKEQVIGGQAPEVQELSKKVLDYEQKFETLNTELEDYKVKFTTAETKLKEINEAKRTELLSTFPDGTEIRKFAEGLSEMDKLENFVKVAKKEAIGVDGGKAGGEVKLDPNKTWDSYSDKELEEIKKKYPSAYQELYSKKYPFKR